MNQNLAFQTHLSVPEIIHIGVPYLQKNAFELKSMIHQNLSLLKHKDPFRDHDYIWRLQRMELLDVLFWWLM